MMPKVISLKKIVSTNQFQFWIVIVVGALLRFFNYGNWSFSNDELSAISRLDFNSLTDLINKGTIIDGHPAGVQVFLFYWTYLTGTSEWAVRFPFVICGVFSIIFFYKLGNYWFDEHVALLSSAIFSTIGFTILYSQLARPYSPGLLFTLMCAYYWAKIIFPKHVETERTNYKHYVLYILSTSACMYTHYFSMLLAGIISLTGFFLLSKNNYKNYIFACACILLLYVPHFRIFIYQFNLGGIGGTNGWLAPPTFFFFTDYLFYIFNQSWFLLLVVFIVAVAGVVLNKEKNSDKVFLFLSGLFFLLPLVIGFIYSRTVNPVLQYSTLLFSMPFFLLLLFYGFSNYKNSQHINFIFYALLITGTVSSVLEKKFYSTPQFSEFKGIAEQITNYDNLYGAVNISKTITCNNIYYFDFYFEKLNHPTKFLKEKIENPQDFGQLRDLVQESKTTFFCNAWSNKYNAPETEQIIMDRYPYIVDEKLYFNSGVVLYTNEKAHEKKAITTFFAAGNNFETIAWANDEEQRSLEKPFEGNYSCKLESSIEYGGTFEKTLGEINGNSLSRIDVSLVAYLTDSNSKAALVISLDSKEKNIFWRAWDMKPYYFTQINKWEKVFLSAQLPEKINADDKLKVYVWNQKKELLFVDDIKIKISNR